MSNTSLPALDAATRHHPAVNLGAFYEASPNADSDAPGLIDITGDVPRSFTYAEMHRQIMMLAAGFSALDIDLGRKVALCLPNSAEFVFAFLALMRVGAVPVLVNPQLGVEALRHVLADADVGAVLADPDAAPNLREASAATPKAIRIGRTRSSGWAALDELVKPSQLDVPVRPMDFDDQAFQPYTAGSTGVPKGIFLTHGGMLWGIEHGELYWPSPPTERGIVAAPMFHKNALRGTIKPVLRGGGSVVIMDRFESRAYLRALAEHRVTNCGGVPAMFAELLRHEDLIETLDFPALKTIGVGSSVVPEQLMERLARAFPNATIKETYGLTEGGGPLRPPVCGRPVPRGSVGSVAPETEVRLLDGEGREHPERGELLIRSPYVLKEYVNLPDLTHERIRDGWLRTGDLFRVDSEGFYFFLGRAHDMFVCGGENIYPKDVEDLVLSHPGVADVVVLPLPHETKGFAPVAIVVPRGGHAITPREIQDFCAARGPSYSIPRAVLIREVIPLTVAKKPDRAKALELLSAAFGPMLTVSRRG